MGKPLTTIAVALLANQRHDSGLLRLTTIAADTEEVVIGTETFTCVAADPDVFEFIPGANADASATNLAASINANTTQPITAYAVASVGVVVFHDLPGSFALATTTTLAGANNAWSAATMLGGTNVPANGQLRTSDAVSRVPTAVEVGVGQLTQKFGFEPTSYLVAVRVTATGVVKAWDGKAGIDPNDARAITINNAGSVDWAATDTVTILAFA
jgi:hypothetical protein